MGEMGADFEGVLHYIDSGSLGFVGQLKVGSVAFGRITAAGTLGSTALGHPAEYGAFTEVVQSFELLF